VGKDMTGTETAQEQEWSVWYAACIVIGLQCEMGGVIWVECSDEGSSASFYVSPGHGRFVAAPLPPSI
jgi:hypothetical protein